ncbi:MAG: hypothetical protein K2X03_17685 [Bryobacteraceae bacterium]|nr:hypothetical protein [Bryobacteraceae bacterium]
MGFALWRMDDQAWASGTHEYRPMGTAVIAASQLFRARDFSSRRRPPSRQLAAFEGMFASLEDVNRHLQRPRPKQGRARLLTVID